MYNKNSEENYKMPITKEEVERAKRRIRKGDLVKVTTKVYDPLSPALFVTRERYLPVVGKYTYIVEAEDTKTGRRYCLPYSEVALQGRGL
ncbi:MAG: hypothetical protein LUE24_13840 [Lachnospiraceae bacterium]|nr:hypothetical protein [Lachnospiraceae bacterium]